MSQTACKCASVSVVIPVFNEQENLPELLRRTLATCREMQRPFEILLIDDGSRDDSTEVLMCAADENPGEILCVLLNRNYGQHNAIRLDSPKPKAM